MSTRARQGQPRADRPEVPARRAAVYARISRDRSGEQLGVARQERECRRLAAARGWEVVAVYVDDDISAYSGKRRPGYEAMVEAVKAGEINAVTAWAPSRLTRHPRQLEDLIDLLDAHRVEVATVASGDYDLGTSGGRLTARVVGSVARHESEERSERLRSKMTQLAETGRHHGGSRPYGYEADGMTVRPEEAEVVKLMARRVLEGLGTRRIANELNDLGLVTAKGREWRATTVAQTLTSPRVSGLVSHRGEIAGPAAWPAILDRDEWDRVQAVLKDPRRKQQRPARYLLTGLLVSPDGVLLSGARTRGNRRLYKTPAGTGPGGVAVDAEQAEAFTVEYVLQRADRTALPKAKAGRRAVPSEVATLEGELEQLAALRGEGTITLREWLAAREPLERRLAEARRRVPATPAVPAGVATALGRKGGLRAAWPDLTYEQQRRALAAVLERVVVEPRGPSGRRFDSTRLLPVLLR